ncbi:MAG TPA: sigma-70 family RNA polymerase sigma factor [Opitutaceae bacterium]|nr:sigma-70 family RNA polymerase sigma factor [Opitutaceae bacterium]HRJ46497.1 sigma-70 family RNA polymerase sigma factor [Opitutaceae bacterium]
MKVPDAETARWFAEEVQVHAPALRAWLRSRFPSQLDVDDLIQEAYVRILKARAAGTVRTPRSLLFTTARNLALDVLRRERVIPMEPITENDFRSVMAGETGVPEAVGQIQELELLTQAIQSLPDRCRQVLTLRKIYGLSQRAIAAQLGIAEHTVEAQVANGMRRCADFLARHGLP